MLYTFFVCFYHIKKARWWFRQGRLLTSPSNHCTIYLFCIVVSHLWRDTVGTSFSIASTTLCSRLARPAGHFAYVYNKFIIPWIGFTCHLVALPVGTASGCNGARTVAYVGVHLWHWRHPCNHHMTRVRAVELSFWTYMGISRYRR